MSSPLESIFITSLTAAPCQKSCTLRFAAVFFKKKTGSNLNLTPIQLITKAKQTTRSDEKCQKQLQYLSISNERLKAAASRQDHKMQFENLVTTRIIGVVVFGLGMSRD